MTFYGVFSKGVCLTSREKVVLPLTQYHWERSAQASNDGVFRAQPATTDDVSDARHWQSLRFHAADCACGATIQGNFMFTRFNSVRNVASSIDSDPAPSGLRARGVLTAAQHTLTIVGVSALAVIAFFYARPELATQMSQGLMPQPASLAALAPIVPAPVTLAAPAAPVEAAAAPVEAAAIADIAPAPLSAKQKALLVTQKQQRWVTSWLSKKYRVAGDAAHMLVSTAYLTAGEIKLDPLLILAVMAIESGLNPFAESQAGAQGLMQVMSKIHHAKFKKLGAARGALDPVANIRVGSLILKDYVTRGGSVEAGLKTYVGAAAFDSDSGYGFKVLAEYHRLKQVAVGKSVPTRLGFPVPSGTGNAGVDKNAAPKQDAEDKLERAPKDEQVAGL
jgi:soluble lytic murein transglycosylase-like protein